MEVSEDIARAVRTMQPPPSPCRPSISTIKDLCALARNGKIAPCVDAQHTPAIGFHNFQRPSVAVNHIADLWLPAEHAEQQAADGIKLFAFEVRPDRFVHIPKVQFALNQPTSIIEPDNGLLFGVVFVNDIAHDLLDDVLDGDQTGRPTVLILDDRHLGSAAAKFREQLVQTFAFRNEIGGPRDIRYFAAVSFHDRLQQILCVHDSHNRVNVVFVNGNACVPGLLDEVGDHLRRIVHIAGVDVNARSHDFPRNGVGEFNDRVNHLAFIFDQFAGFGSGSYDLHALLFGDNLRAEHFAETQPLHDECSDDPHNPNG